MNKEIEKVVAAILQKRADFLDQVCLHAFQNFGLIPESKKRISRERIACLGADNGVTVIVKNLPTVNIDGVDVIPALNELVIREKVSASWVLTGAEISDLKFFNEQGAEI